MQIQVDGYTCTCMYIYVYIDNISIHVHTQYTCTHTHAHSYMHLSNLIVPRILGISRMSFSTTSNSNGPTCLTVYVDVHASVWLGVRVYVRTQITCMCLHKYTFMHVYMPPYACARACVRTCVWMLVCMHWCLSVRLSCVSISMYSSKFIHTSTGLSRQQRHARFWLLKFVHAQETTPPLLVHSQVQRIQHWKGCEIATHVIHDTLKHTHIDPWGSW